MVDVTEEMVLTLVVPNFNPVISASVFPPAVTLMSIGEFVTVTVKAPDVQPNAVHTDSKNAVHTFRTAFLIPSSSFKKMNKIRHLI